MKIYQMMTRDVKTCRATETLDRAARLMWDHDIGALPVVDEVGQVIGMVTDRDICMAAYTKAQPLHDLPVATAMSKHVVTCGPDDSTAAVASLLAKHLIHRIPVVDGEQLPIGIVTLNDLAVAMADGQDVQPTELARTLAAICEHRRATTAATA